MNYQGYVIARERLAKSWSQEGLCKGICTVSYLSKIENGKADPSEQILCLLFERLGLLYQPALENEAAELAQKGYEMLFTCRFSDLDDLLRECNYSHFSAAKAGLDLEMLAAMQNSRVPLPSALESCMDTRVLALQRILQNRDEEAVLLYPNAYTHLMAGISAYETGNYSNAIVYLQSAYELAAAEGSARVMLECKLFLGNCYCNQQDLSNMEQHYQVAHRLADDLKDQRAIWAIDYNTASSWIEIGRYEDAYVWFAKRDEPSMMSLHKLAICCEKTGRRVEGLTVLDQAEGMETDELDTGLANQLCSLVRYRLEHADYLEREEYGELLLTCFQRCRSELASGYATFHLPWVLEWYKATRQYKKARELLEEFPVKYH